MRFQRSGNRRFGEIIDKLEKRDKIKTKEITELPEHKIERIGNINRLNSSKSKEPLRNTDVLIIGTSVVKDLEPINYRNKHGKINTLKEKKRGARSFIQSKSNKMPVNNVVKQVDSNDSDFEDSVDQVIPPFLELLEETKECMPLTATSLLEKFCLDTTKIEQKHEHLAKKARL
ncbi:unnamed protein product [Mytilus edulis]|uniref:Uncharacterized protein n=1 Tax=Mytilus edulis TaxID=6550 RepID=A0A8S3Q530_MYTED|nr:unnamed protein product [Mytilus edulis]